MKKDRDVSEPQRRPYPGDVCQVSAEASTDTAFQVACAVVNVFSRHDQVMLSLHKQFNRGWEVGVERDLGDHMFPNLHNTEHTDPTSDEAVAVYNSQRAFTLGLVAGLVAEQKGYSTPFCIVAEHNNECEAYDAHGNRRPEEVDRSSVRSAHPTQVAGDVPGGFDLTPRTIDTDKTDEVDQVGQALHDSAQDLVHPTSTVTITLQPSDTHPSGAAAVVPGVSDDEAQRIVDNLSADQMKDLLLNREVTVDLTEPAPEHDGPMAHDRGDGPWPDEYHGNR